VENEEWEGIRAACWTRNEEEDEKLHELRTRKFHVEEKKSEIFLWEKEEGKKPFFWENMWKIRLKLILKIYQENIFYDFLLLLHENFKMCGIIRLIKIPSQRIPCFHSKKSFIL
jgi:hypothetical protein